MARYLFPPLCRLPRDRPREPGRNTPLQAVNGHSLKCDYRLAWIVIRGRRGGSAAQMAVGKLVDIAPRVGFDWRSGSRKICDRRLSLSRSRSILGLEAWLHDEHDGANEGMYEVSVTQGVGKLYQVDGLSGGINLGLVLTYNSHALL